MKEVIFEANGIEVFIEDGVLVEADDNSRYEFEDTPENREKGIEDAKRTVEEWNR